MNPLLKRNCLPSFEEIKVEHISPAIDKIITENTNTIKIIERDKQKPNWDNFVKPLEKCEERLSRAWSQISHLNSVMNNDSLRKEYNTNLIKITKYYSTLGQNEIIYKKFKSLDKSSEKFNLIQKKIIKNELLGFKLAGVSLPKIKKKQFKKIKNQLSQHCSKFEENVLDSVNEFSLLIKDESKLKGIPKDIINMSNEKAIINNKDGWLFTLDFPSYIPVLQYADDRELRKQLYRAYSVKASELAVPKFDNTKTIRHILKLRNDLSSLLNYKNFSEMALETRMADTADEIITFLQDLANKAKPFAEKDMLDLNRIGKAFDIDIPQAWDIAYLSEKLKKEKFDFSDTEIKKYFPINKVIDGLFGVVSKIYGLSFKKTKTQVWHKDVIFYEIYNESNNLLGQFYFDLYARKNKRGGAWMDEAISKYNFDDDSALPVAFLTCNFTAPVKNKSAYLNHDEIVTLFHEFGHGLHHLLTEIDYYSVSGIKGVEWDAVELPSQFMENFCWEWSVIKTMTENMTTKKKMPKSLFNKLLKSKNFQSGLQTLRQVEFSLFDIKLHSNTYNHKQKFLDILEEVRDEVAVIRPPKWNRFSHSFSHIFAGGYAAGYYSYKWAEVLSADAYSMFEEEGILSKTTGENFKREVLSKGGSRGALDSFTAFRGRPPTIDALLKHHGLKL